MNVISSNDSNLRVPVLRLLWHNSQYGIDAHRLFLEIPQRNPTLFPPTDVRVEVLSRIDTIKNGKIISSFDIKTSRHLPCTIVGDVVVIPLDDTKIHEMLLLNKWTKAKKSSKTSPKEYPLELSVEFDNFRAEYGFDVKAGQTPYLLSNQILSDIEIGDKREVIIQLN